MKMGHGHSLFLLSLTTTTADGGGQKMEKLEKIQIIFYPGQEGIKMDLITRLQCTHMLTQTQTQMELVMVLSSFIKMRIM